MGKPQLKTKPIKQRSDRVSFQLVQYNIKIKYQKAVPLAIFSQFCTVGTSERHKRDVTARVVMFDLATDYVVARACIKQYTQVLDANGIDFARELLTELSDVRDYLMQIIYRRRIVGINATMQCHRLSLPLPKTQIYDLEKTERFSGVKGECKALEEIASEMCLECETEAEKCAVVKAMWRDVEKKEARERAGWWRKREM